MSDGSSVVGYNKFCIERSAKMGFLKDFGGGADIWWEPP